MSYYVHATQFTILKFDRFFRCEYARSEKFRVMGTPIWMDILSNFWLLALEFVQGLS